MTIEVGKRSQSTSSRTPGADETSGWRLAEASATEAQIQEIFTNVW
jgi:hypothetical protein